MKEKYLNELPSGYRLKEEINLSKGAYALACAGVGVVTLFFLFFVADFFEGFDILLSPFVFMLYFAPGAALYMFVYAGACGLTFKLLTKGPVEYFVNAKYCLASMPQSFIDLKTRVLAGVFPAAVFTPILAGALVLSGPSTLPYLFVASAASCHAIILMIELRVLLKLRKYKGQGALINSARDCTAVFVNDGIDGEPDQTTEGYLEWLDSDEMRIGDSERERRARRIRSVGITLFSFSLLLFGLGLFRILSVKYPVYESLWTTPPLYIVIALVGLIVYYAATKGKHHFAKVGIVVVLLASLFLSWLFAIIEVEKLSYTTNVENYGSYDKYVDYVPDFFPDEISDDMTPIRYSYRYDASWDIVYEIYLEVQLTDEAYKREVSRFKAESVECWYAEGYREYVLSDEIGRLSGDEYNVTNYPDIVKVVFCDSTKTVIYEVFTGYDPFCLDDSAYFTRFDIDPRTYKNKIEEID